MFGKYLKFVALIFIVCVVCTICGLEFVQGQGGQRAFQGTTGIPSDVYFEAALGNVVGIEDFHQFGKNPDIDTAAPEDVWNGGLTYTGHPTGAAETMEIFSSSVNDVAAGSGALTVEISHLLDGTGAESPAITVTLNGTTPVSLGALTYYRCTKVKVLTAGATGSNEGTLTLRHTSTTANIFCVMPIGANETTIFAYTVPLGKTLVISAGSVQMARASGAAGSATISFRARPNGGVYNTIVSPEISHGSGFTVNGKNYMVFTARTDIKLRVDDVSDNDTIVTGNIRGLLIKN